MAKRAAVIGSGPNGLAAAVTFARAGIPVTVFEAHATIGGGARTAEPVLPGIRHDTCSAIHPMALASEFFRRFRLAERIEFAAPAAAFAHPLDGRDAAIAYRSLDRTVAELGRDGAAYRALLAPLVDRADGVFDLALGGSALRLPRDPRAAGHTAAAALWQGLNILSRRGFRDAAAPALFTGAAAHANVALPSLAAAAIGLVLSTAAHTVSWPVPIGGSAAITAALADDLAAHGGAIVTGQRIHSLADLRGFDVLLFDTSARDLVRIAGDALPASYRRRLARFRFGSAAAKVDLVLSGPIPWRDARVAQAPTVHLGGTRAEIEAAEWVVAHGRHPTHPYVLLAQPDRFDPGRNPPGRHAVWTYTHVPAGSTVDVTERVLAQLERFAPGVRDLVVASRCTTAAELGDYNPNYGGGDISTGAVGLRQLVARPVVAVDPWRTPARGVYLASAAAAPGPGVHGLAGWYAARSALRHEFGVRDAVPLG